MNEYRKIALETRKKVSKLTLDQQKEMLKVYEGAIDNLASKAAAAKDKSLTKRWALDYTKVLKNEKNKLHEEIRRQTIKAVEASAELAVYPEEWFYKKVFNKINIDTGPHFTQMFSQGKKGVIEDIISGELYKDNKNISDRIWSYGNKFEGDIQHIINRGMLEGKSALELARDLEKFAKDPAKRGWSWGKVYPNLRGTKVDYNTQRLARTSINHTYQNATIKSSSMNPFVEGIEWQSALQHGRTCDLCKERHGHIYLFGIEEVPLDHPQGLCTMLPYIPKSLDQVADELRGWLDGHNNPNLERWYNKYGEHFAFKEI